MFKKLATAFITLGALAATVTTAAACGGLVAPNGAIRLARATTLVDWHDGVEHYMTSFSYQGGGFKDFGWIVPLPAVPVKVEEGGGWTLQRLFRETHPVPQFADLAAARGAAPLAPALAEVLQQVQVRALDITVLRGSGQAIVDWCAQNKFYLSPETRAHLLVYAKGSPIFMAAKYNVARAQATRQLAGDGAPVLITMKVPHLWVPLEVLANGTQQVNADLYLMTRDRVYTSDLAAFADDSPEGSFVPGGSGFAVQYQKPIDDSLFRDLSSDKNMGWVQRHSWLTYLQLNAPATTVTYDLGISSAGVIRLAAYGTKPMAVADGTRGVGSLPESNKDAAGDAFLPPGVGTLVAKGLLVLAVAVGVWLALRRRAARIGSA